MNSTKNLGLNLPEEDDFFTWNHVDENMEKIDKLAAPEYENAKKLEELQSGEGYTTLISKLAKAVKDFITHLNDKLIHTSKEEKERWNTVTEKVNKEEGKGLSHNDFTDTYKKKLDGIEAGANKTVIDSELSKTSTNPVENKVIYQEKIKRMAQDWSGYERYSLGIGEPDSSTPIGSYLDVETGKVYYGGNSSWSYVYTLSSIYDALDNTVDKSNIANNLVTTEEGYVADARQLNKSIENSFAYEIDKSISAIKSSLNNVSSYCHNEFDMNVSRGDANGLVGGNHRYFMIFGKNCPENHGFLETIYFSGAGFTPLGEGGGAPLTKQVFTAYGNANTYVRMYMHAQNNFTAWNKLN